MAGYYININIKTDDAARVREAVTATFTSEGFQFLGDASAADMVDDASSLNEGDEGYAALVTGVSGNGWVTVYVADWQDSGFLAKRLSQSLNAPILEVWVAKDVHWGYTYYEHGEVRDRFADDASQIAETAEEATLYRGQPEALAAVLKAPLAQFAAILTDARKNTGQFAGAPVDALAQAVGLPFEHLFTGYEYFLEDDPEDYGPDLENWAEFRFLAFQPPKGRQTLSE